MSYFANFKKEFEDGLYHQAQAYKTPAPEDWRQSKVMSYEYAAAKARELGFYPEEKEARRREQLMLKAYGVPEWATEKQRRVCAHVRDSWWLEEYFRQHKVEMEGPTAPSLGAALDATTSKAFSVVPAELTVFPFFWDTQIVEGILAVPLLDVLVMDTVTVASGTAVHAVMNETLTDRQMGETGEFASYQEVNITSTESPLRLKKFGGAVTISDEAMRRQRIPVFARGIARIGRQIGIDMTDLAIDVLINGDTTYGGINGAATTVATAVPGSPTYADYVTLTMNFDIGYEPTDAVLTRNGLIKLLNIPQFQDPLSGFKFQSQGVLPEAFGLQTHRWDSAGSTSWNSGAVGTGTSLLMVQRQRALILYQEGGLSTESDRDPRSESTFVKTSWYLIFGKWDSNAVRLGTGYA